MSVFVFLFFFFFSSRRRHTRLVSDWSSDVCSSDLTALVLLFDHLPIDQIGMGLLHWVLGTARLAGAWKGLQGMVDLDQCREVTAESIAEKARDAQDHRGRHLDELQGTCKRPWANERRQDQTKFRSETDPDPLPPIHAQFTALSVRAGLLGMLAPDEVPHLIEL